MADPRPSGVLITRPEPGAGETAVRLAAMGLTPILAPAMAIEARRCRAPGTAALAAVLVTSRNALAAIGSDFHHTPLLAVGDATASRARALGFTRVSSADGDGMALAALVMRECRPAEGPLLLLSGQVQGQSLAAHLRHAGFRVIRRVAYAARPTRSLPDAARDALRSGQVRAALFFSTETARSFIRLIRQAGLTETLTDIEAVAIGAAAGVALKALPWRHVGVAGKPTQDAMLALLR